jgi:DNA-directed RNA polymerase specialized sigma24 family protein
VLFYAYGYDLNEIGDMLGLSHANARAILSRTRRRLARDWEDRP